VRVIRGVGPKGIDWVGAALKITQTGWDDDLEKYEL